MDVKAFNSGVENDKYGGLRSCQFVFGGMNNVIDRANLDIDKGQLVDAINVDLDNSNSASRRLGYKQVTLTGIPATGYHSAWSNDTKTVAYFCIDNFLYSFDGTSARLEKILLNDNSVEFCQVNDIVVYSNGTEIGSIGGTNTQVRLYSPEFKVSTIAGRNLEFYNGRLYFSRNNSLFCTDVFDVEHMDVRFNRVATFPHNITMNKRVEDGLWIGTEQYTYFLKGDDIIEGGFEQILVAKAGVVYGTACKINAEYIPDMKQSENNLVIFTSTTGVCVGGNNGSWKNLSFLTMSFDVGIAGCSALRYEQGMTQYITTFDMDATYEYNPYTYDMTIDVNTL